MSGSGALGFYPWIDRVHGTYGIVAVDDEVHRPEHAVPTSQRIARLLWNAGSAACTHTSDVAVGSVSRCFSEASTA